MPKVSGSAPFARLAATTRASARADAIGSAMSPSAASASEANRAGVTVIALPLRLRLNGREDRHAHVTEPEARRDGDRRQQMRGVEQADVELVPDIRPRYVAHEVDMEALRRRKALVGRDDRRRRVDQRNEADAQPGVRAAHLSRSAAVTTDWAMSTIFLFSFMAVRRISA